MDLRPSSPGRRKSLAAASRAYHEQLKTDQAALAYLESRGLRSSADQAMLGVVRSPRQGHDRFLGRLAIPFIGPKGNVYDIRYRCIEDHDCKERGHGKYDAEHGYPTRLFNTRALVSPTDYIMVTEGEVDALTLAACNWPAVGVPGANAWKAHHSRCFDGFSDIVVIGDGDDAGRKFVAAVVKTLPSARSVILSAGEDVNSVYVKGGKDALVAALKEDEA